MQKRKWRILNENRRAGILKIARDTERMNRSQVFVAFRFRKTLEHNDRVDDYTNTNAIFPQRANTRVLCAHPKKCQMTFLSRFEHE